MPRSKLKRHLGVVSTGELQQGGRRCGASNSFFHLSLSFLLLRRCFTRQLSMVDPVIAAGS